MAVDSKPLRFLLACRTCKRQFDAGSLPLGSLFHCSCGEKIRVPRLEARDVAVARCSACGAPRAGRGPSCPSCGSDFSLHERDLHTICPACMARISDKARFCHHCAVPIAPQGRAGEPTDSPCPACPNGRTLSSRRLGADEVTVLECQACAGLWLGRDAFRLVADKARSMAADDLDQEPEVAPAPTSAPRRGPLYRRCPECGSMMHRRNFARRSKVILDVCKDHGYWFDPRELERVLAWIRAGGESRELRRVQREEQEERSRSRLDRAVTDRVNRMAGGAQSSFAVPAEGASGGDLLNQLLRALFDA